MKTIKIIIGIFLIYGAGEEYISASRQLGSLFNPGIILGILVILLFATWLIGSAFSANKFRIKSFEFLKFFMISMVVFLIVAIISLGAKAPPSNFIEVNGLKIPLGKCVDGNKRIIADEKEREKYCACFVEKITNDPEMKLKYQDRLENNKIEEVSKEIQSSPNYLKLGIADCMLSIEVDWTDYLANSMKRNWVKEFSGTAFEETNDIEKYCDCLLIEYRKYPLRKILEDEFSESNVALLIDEKCSEKSLKK